MYSTDGGKTDPVRLFKLWLSKRPSGMKDKGPLYLSVINRPKSNDIWYTKIRMGENTIDNIMKSMASCLKTNKKLTNHSMKKTLVSKLKKSGQPRNVICEITGRARESSLDDYDEIDENQRKELSHIISGFKVVPNETVPTTFPIKTVQLQRHQQFKTQSNSQSYTNEHHLFLLIAPNSKVKCTRPWNSWILIFRLLVLQDFRQVVPHSFSTAWQRWLVLVILLLHRRITPAVLSIFSPKKTRCLSHNRRRSEGLILLSQTTRIKLWRRIFLQWQDFRIAWTFARMKFLRSNGFFVKWHLSFCFVDMARTCKRVSGSSFYEPAFWTNKYRLKKNEWFQNGCNKVVIELRVVQFWSEIILVISNRTRADFEITRMISDQIVLHSVQLPLLIYCDQEPLWLLNDCYFLGVYIRLSIRCKIFFFTLKSLSLSFP